MKLSFYKVSEQENEIKETKMRASLVKHFDKEIQKKKTVRSSTMTNPED